MYSVIFYILALCIILACLFFLWKDKEKVFNLKAVFNIFYLLFFGVIPIFQYSERASFFGGRTLLPLEYVTVTTIFFVIVISFNAIYNYLSKKKTARFFHGKAQEIPLRRAAEYRLDKELRPYRAEKDACFGVDTYKKPQV